MISKSLPIRPSNDLEVLSQQILRELERLANGDQTEPQAYRAYLQYSWALTWEKLAKGDVHAPAGLRQQLKGVRRFIDQHLPELSPSGEAAAELLHTLRALDAAGEPLAEVEVERALADRRSSPTEREVLRVFLENAEYLRRGEVCDRMRAWLRPSDARVGQILAQLYDDGLLQRYQRSALGGQVSFYALSARGKELCRRLELDREDQALIKWPGGVPAMGALFETLLDSRAAWEERALVACTLASPYAANEIQPYVVELLAQEGLDTEATALLQTILALQHYSLRALAMAVLRKERMGSFRREFLETVKTCFAPEEMIEVKLKNLKLVKPLPAGIDPANERLIIESARVAQNLGRSALYPETVESTWVDLACFNGREADRVFHLKKPARTEMVMELGGIYAAAAIGKLL